MNMKVLIVVAIALAAAAILLLSTAEEGVSMGGESHDLTPQSSGQHK